MRDPGTAPGERGAGPAPGSPGRRRRRSEPRQPELRGLERRGQSQSDPEAARRPRVGRGRHRHPRRPRRRQGDHGDVLRQAAAAGRRDSIVRRLPRDAGEGAGHPGHRQHHAGPSARQHQHRRPPAGRRRHLAQAGGERPPRGPPHGRRGAREQRPLPSARLQQQPRSAHAGGLDQRRRDRHGSRGAQLDQPSVLAAGHVSLSPERAAGAGGLQLGAVAGTGGRSSLPSELYLRGLSGLVRVRHGLPRRHGSLQPVAALSHPEPRRARVRRRPAEQRRVGRRTQRQHGRTRLDGRLPEGQHRPLAPPRHREPPRRWTRSGTTAA